MVDFIEFFRLLDFSTRGEVPNSRFYLNFPFSTFRAGGEGLTNSRFYLFFRLCDSSTRGGGLNRRLY